MAMTLPRALGVDLRGRSLARVRDWTAAELEAVLDLADELKAKQRSREPHRLLEGRTARSPVPQALDADEGLARGRGSAPRRDGALPPGRSAPARARRAR